MAKLVKAPDSDSGTRRFESFFPCQFAVPMPRWSCVRIPYSNPIQYPLLPRQQYFSWMHCCVAKFHNVNYNVAGILMEPVTHMIIRKLTPADAEAYRAFRLAGLLEAPLAFWASPEEELLHSIEVMGERLLETPFQTMFGVLDGTQLVGVAALKREPVAKISHRALIWGVYLAPQARGIGAARRLMEALIAHARTVPQLVQLCLCVRSDNESAKALYAKLGFEPTGVDRRSIYFENIYYDENRMVLMLDA